MADCIHSTVAPDTDRCIICGQVWISGGWANPPAAAPDGAQPVAWACTDYDGHVGVGLTKEEAKRQAGESCNEYFPLYTTPPQPQDAARDIKPDGFDAIQIAECQDLEQLRNWAGCMRRERDNWRRDAQALAEQLARDREDAERYRHARNHHLDEMLAIYPTSDTSDVGLDAAIDAARVASSTTTTETT